MRKIILASQSPQRKLLMQALGLPFEIQPADIDEKGVVEENQQERARLIALKKARAISEQDSNKEAIIIAADTFTLFNDRAYEKPENLDEARQMLREQSGKEGHCYSGFAYLDSQNNIEFSTTAITKFKYRELSENEIEIYVTQNPVMTWSASFCPAYPAGINMVDDISGSLSSFSHGLPMEFLTKKLKESGVFK